ncbi:MAG TPA: hypothetical protein VF444_21385 [Pseudonocardiaceae bacterium]
MDSDEAAVPETPEPEFATRRRAAARTVAANARNAGELAEMLDMLGLSAAEGVAREDPRPLASTPEPTDDRPEDRRVLMRLMMHAAVAAAATRSERW